MQKLFPERGRKTTDKYIKVQHNAHIIILFHSKINIIFDLRMAHSYVMLGADNYKKERMS